MSNESTFPGPDGQPGGASSEGATPRTSNGADQNSAADREKQAERRRRRRALISAPVRVRGMYGGSNIPDEISTTVDVSRNGFLFISARANFSQGMTVAVTFPYSNSPMPLQAEQPGRVVRVSELSDGRFAVAVALVPFRGEASAARPRSQATSGNRTAGASGHRSATYERPLVIVVDSDSQIRESIKDALGHEGYEVMALPTARQAHALLNQMLPALVIAEIEGEELPGYDLCARIKSTPRLEHVPVVLTTRSAYPSDYSNAHSLGAIVCMAKPFRIDRIGHVVRLLVPAGARLRMAAAASAVDQNQRPAKDSNDSGDPSFRLRR
jgi:CheY-like chemotaxis protein